MCITSHLDFISKRPGDNSDMTIITNVWPRGLLFEQDTLLNATSTVSGAFIPDWKVHHRVQLVPPTSVVRESLEVDDQDTRQRPQVKLFCCLLVFFTCWAIPTFKINTQRVNNRDRTEGKPSGHARPYQGSCSPSVSMVVKSSMHSFRATVAFFF